MRACIQRVSRAKATRVATGETSGEIRRGLVVFLGVRETDTQREVSYLARKVVSLRIFEDENGKMNLSLTDVGGQMLLVSQFTLYADCRKGKRPSFVQAARAEKAAVLYEMFVEEVRKLGIEFREGFFQQDMAVELVNDGPVTIWIDTEHHENVPRKA